MKALKKVVATAAVCALAFGVVGCGGGDKPATTNADEAATHTSEEIKAQDITVEQSGYSLTTTEGIGPDGKTTKTPAVDYAFIVKNPNTGYVAQNVPFNVNGYNAAGEVVFSGGASCMYIYPGIETAISGTANISAAEGLDTKITQFTVEPLLSTVEWLETKLTPDQLNGMFKTSDVQTTDVDGTLNLTASVTGDISYADKIYRIVDLENTLEGHAVAVFYNDAGDIVFGSDSTNVLIDQTTMDNAKNAGEGAPINNVTVTVQNPPAYKEVKLFVMPSL